MLKKLGVVFGVLVLILLGFYLKDKEHLDAFPHIIPSFYAKEYCSCRYVMQRDAQFCDNHATLFLPVGSVNENVERKEVNVSALGVWATASYQSPRTGCQLR